MEIVPEPVSSFRHRSKSARRPKALWYRSSATFARSFMTMAETVLGSEGTFSRGGTGARAIWQCTISIAVRAVKGTAPVSIS